MTEAEPPALFKLLDHWNANLRLPAFEQVPYPLTVEAGDVLAFDLLGALRLAGEGVGAATEAQLIHLADHLAHTVGRLGLALRQQAEVADLGGDEQHGAGVLARRHTGTAADAGGGIHRLVGLMLRNQDGIGVGGAARGGTDIAAGLDDFIKSTAVDHQVFHHGESLGTPRLDPDFVAVVETAHVQLTGGDTVVVAVRPAIDIETTHATDTLATVVVEANGMGDGGILNFEF